MSVRPIAFYADGSVDLWHDERQHGGTIQIDTGTRLLPNPLTGETLIDGLEVSCPVPGCGSVSTWPISGGANAAMGQEIFIRKLRRYSGPLPGLPDRPATAEGRRPFATVAALVKARAEALDGPGRFVLGTLTEADVDDTDPTRPPRRV